MTENKPARRRPVPLTPRARGYMAVLGQRALEERPPDLELEGFTRRVYRGKQQLVVQPDADPWVALYQLRFLDEELEALRSALVAQLRAEGFDWDTIAVAVGQSRPTVARRFAGVDDLPEVQALYARVAQQMAELRANPSRRARGRAVAP